jgi:ABC-2 family transporter protein
MIWMAWRQFRAQAVTGLAALAAFAVMLGITGPRLAHLYDTSGLGACHTGCGGLANVFLRQLEAAGTYQVSYEISIVIVLAAPAIIGAFWGAPLVAREIEAGTFRLAWNQSITRARWLAAKLALAGLAAMATAELFSLMQAWWAAPLGRVAPLAQESSLLSMGRLVPLVFAIHGITPLGYAAFAFALGVTAGVIIRRPVPAMAVTLAIFAAVQLVMPVWIRPHLIPPVRVTSAFNPNAITGLLQSGSGQMTVTDSVNIPGAWVLSNQTITPAGHVFTGPAPQACTNGSPDVCGPALAKLHLRQLAFYQPASRYWAFQGIETGIFVALALLLAWFCFWWVRRRLS